MRLPASVSAAQGYSSGTVTVTVKQGVRTVARRRVKLRRACTYLATVAVGHRGRLTMQARFDGNDLLVGRNSPARGVRAG